MRIEETDTDREPTDERTEERANADTVGVDTPNLGFIESGASSMIGAATDRTNRIDRRGMIQVIGTVGVADVAGCPESGETWTATTVSNDIKNQ